MTVLLLDTSAVVAYVRAETTFLAAMLAVAETMNHIVHLPVLCLTEAYAQPLPDNGYDGVLTAHPCAEIIRLGLPQARALRDRMSPGVRPGAAHVAQLAAHLSTVTVVTSDEKGIGTLMTDEERTGVEFIAP